MKSFIKKLLRETLDEIYFMRHSNDRIKERLNIFSDEDIPKGIKMAINKNLDILNSYEFNSSKSYGIMLGNFNPNPNSDYYVEMRDGRGYYSIIDDKVIHDSTGDQFWIIVRENNATTVMLRKAIQTADIEHNKEKLSVDVIIKDLGRYIQDKESGTQVNVNRFKKTKLPNGKVVRYYDAINKFETLEGTPIKIDDIFDELAPEMQDMVLSKMD